MKTILNIFNRTALLAMIAISFLLVSSAYAQVNIGWNFTDLNATYDTGTPANFTVGDMSIGNSYGSVTGVISTTSTSNIYTGATGGGNIGNACRSASLSTGTSPYYAVTFTPTSGYSLQITKFNFGTRSTATGPQNYALYSSADNYTAAICNGTIANNSTWAWKDNGTFALNGAASTPVTLRLYVYGYTGNPASGSINSRVDDVTITVASNVAPTQVRVETAPDGTGSVVSAQSLASGSAVTVYAISRDASNNFMANVAADSWSLLNNSGGVADGDLVVSGDKKSATFTGNKVGSAVIHAASGSLTSTDSGAITVTVGAATKVGVETAADGSGSIVSAQNLTVGQALAVYAISRDASGNFVTNITPDSWSLSTATGSVVSGDLQGSGASATFTANHEGTAVIHAASGSLISTDSGVLTVTAAPTNPTGVGSALPTTVISGSNVTLTVVVTPGANPTSSGIAVTGDMTAIGGSAGTSFTDSGDGVTFVKQATVSSGVTAGAYSIPVSITDGQSRTASTSISVSVVNPTNPTAVGGVSLSSVAVGGTTTLTVTVTPGTNPTSTGVTVTADLSSIGGASNVSLTGAGNVFTAQAVVGSGVSAGSKSLSITITDAQSRTTSTSIAMDVRIPGPFTIFHLNDTHARITPHQWIIPAHANTSGTFETVGGAAYVAGEMLALTGSNTNSLVIDAGDISEGNPVGDMGGNGSTSKFYALLSAKLKAQNGRGMDAVVVGNHDVRDATYISNLQKLNDGTFTSDDLGMNLPVEKVPVISMNVCSSGTTPYFSPYTIVTVNGTKVGILGYTTQSAEVGASLSGSLSVVNCDWNGSASGVIHIASYVKKLRNELGCDIVVLAAHVGHSAIATDSAVGANDALLKDDGSVKLPEVAVTGHWHTWSDTVWQPETLNYKTIFTESASYMKYIGELNVTAAGKYVSSQQHIIKDSVITPDSEINQFVVNLTGAYNATHSVHTDDVIGYTADALMLDNKMKWWSADEYPWSGNNTAGQWICDAMKWKAERLFGSCDLSIETGGGVRSDIPAGPVTYMQIYETFPWNDDTFTLINMTGQEIVDFIKKTNCDTGFSKELDVTAYDGIPTTVLMSGSAINLTQTYKVAINNYMLAHPPSGVTWSGSATAQNNSYLCREGLVDYMRQYDSRDNAYHVGGERYHLNTEFSGGFRAVVTMVDDNDTRPTFCTAYLRLLEATPETLARRGSAQVPNSLVNADGTINRSNRLSVAELYRSFLSVKTGVLHNGDIIEVWGKGSFYAGNPEFVDQEGIWADGVEFKKLTAADLNYYKGTVDSSPKQMSYISDFWNDQYKNEYVQFLARKSGTNSVCDRNGLVINLSDVTGYASQSVSGSTGELVRITGIPTLESYAQTFRTAEAVTAASQNIYSYAPVSLIGSLPDGTQTSGTLTLSATAAIGEAGGLFKLVLNSSADSQVASGKPTTNYGTSSSSFYIQSSGTSSYGNERVWVKYDLSTLPSFATNISAASMKLWCYKATGAAINASVCTGASDTWTETGINWNNQPSLSGTLATWSLSGSSVSTWLTADVSSLANSQLQGDKIVSLCVKAETENLSGTPSPSYGVDPKEYSGGSKAPALELTTNLDSGVTLSQVEFFYQYSLDGVTWSSGSSCGVVSGSNWNINFTYPSGNGYYRFYTQATDSVATVQTSAASNASSALQFTKSDGVPAIPRWALAILGLLLLTAAAQRLTRKQAS